MYYDVDLQGVPIKLSSSRSIFSAVEGAAALEAEAVEEAVVVVAQMMGL